MKISTVAKSPVSIIHVLGIMLCIFFSCTNNAEHSGSRYLWKGYDQYRNDSTLISPKEYADYLRTKFPKQLDSLPKLGIIFYEQHIPEYLDSLGFKPNEIKVFALGEMTPEILYVVRPANPAQQPFVITGGLPGAGGVSTQAAELGGLGVQSIIHLGSCGFLDTTIKASDVLLSKGSYNDGAAALLANIDNSDVQEALSYPDSAFRHSIEEKLSAGHLTIKGLYGVTLPIFYYQPQKLVRDVLESKTAIKPSYIEMEGAPFFQTGRLGKFQSASIVMGTDYYYLKNGRVKHYFVDFNSKQLKIKILRALVL